jgi:rubrerythrin
MSAIEEELIEFFRQQEKLEKEIAKSINKALKTIKNPAVEAVLKGISYDSSKHAEIYKSIVQIIAVAPAMTEEEYKRLEELVKWHIESEEKLISRLQQVIDKTSNDKVKFLLESILTDERRHHDLLNLVMEIIVKGETITDEDWWDIIWKNVPFHGAPGG